MCLEFLTQGFSPSLIILHQFRLYALVFNFFDPSPLPHKLQVLLVKYYLLQLLVI